MSQQNKEQDYFIATKDVDGVPLIYTSDIYKLSEIDIINLIKICVVEGRAKALGKKILEAYRDSTEYRKEITNERLTKIGITENGERKPDTARKSKFK